MIQIKAFFGDWKSADKDHAKRFVKHMIQGMVAVSDYSERARIIEQKHLRGIAVAELMV